MITVSELRDRRQERNARAGNCGPVVAALHATADLMDARDQHLSGYAWSRYAKGTGRRPAAGARSWEALSLLGAAFPAAYGMTWGDKWSDVWAKRKRDLGRAAAMEWLRECRAVYAELAALLAPAGVYGAPALTSAQVRDIAAAHVEGGDQS